MGKLVASEKGTGGKVPCLLRCLVLLELTPGGIRTAPGETVGGCSPLYIASETPHWQKAHLWVGDRKLCGLKMDLGKRYKREERGDLLRVE